MRVACSSSPVCWGCAVKKITSTHVCWQCGEMNISTDTHLVRDQVLRSFVEQFVKTGKLDPVHERALKNGQAEAGSRVNTIKVEQNQPKVEESEVMPTVTSIDKGMLNKALLPSFLKTVSGTMELLRRYMMMSRCWFTSRIMETQRG